MCCCLGTTTTQAQPVSVASMMVMQAANPAALMGTVPAGASVMGVAAGATVNSGTVMGMPMAMPYQPNMYPMHPGMVAMPPQQMMVGMQAGIMGIPYQQNAAMGMQHGMGMQPPGLIGSSQQTANMSFGEL